MMRTTIDINDALLTELRKEAAASHKSFRVTVEETLQKGLAAKSSSVGNTLELPTFPLGLKAAYRGMSMNQLYDHLETEDLRKVAV